MKLYFTYEKIQPWVCRIGVVAVVSSHLISSLVPRRKPKDVQKSSTLIPVFNRCCCGPQWLPSHLLSLTLSLSLPFSSGRLCPICSRLTDWTWIHATIWIFKHANRIHRKRPQFGWKSKTLDHSLYRNTLWDGNGIHHANVMFYSRSLNFWIQPKPGGYKK